VLQTYRDIADFSGKDVLDSEFSSLTHFCSRQIIRGLKPIDTPFKWDKLLLTMSQCLNKLFPTVETASHKKDTTTDDMLCTAS
jgi:hypothetical protein